MIDGEVNDVAEGQEGAAGAVSTPEGGQVADPAKPVDLSDDTMVTWKGLKAPVKFNQVRSWQSQFTKAQQATKQLQNQLQERENQIKQLTQRQQQMARQPSPQAGEDPYSQLRSLKYLSGEDAVGVVQHLAGALKQRDQVMKVLAARLLKNEEILNGLHKTHVTGDFDRKINKWLEDMGEDPEMAIDAKAFYLAHEGEDLDETFPDLYREHVEKRRAIEKRRAAQLKAPRQTPFVPGKGGKGSAAKELNLDGKTGDEQAEMLWEAFVQDGQRT